MAKTGEDYTDRTQLFRRVLKQCLHPNDERILLIGDRGDGERLAAPVLTEAFSKACEEEGYRYETIWQNVKLRGEIAAPQVINKLKELPKNSIIMVNVSNRLGRMRALNLSFRKYARERGHRFTSAASLGNIRPEQLPVLIDSLDIDYNEVHQKALQIKQMLDDGREAAVTTKAGTDLVYGIEGMQSTVSTGLYTDHGTGGNLPGAETYIAPHKNEVEGIAVIDGSSRVQNNTQLITSPTGIKMTIKKGKVIKMNSTTEARALQETLDWANANSKHPWGIRRIGELGIGMNPKAQLIGATIIDEKVQGTAHLALGSNHWFGGSVYSIIHLDQVMRDATIKVDSRTIRP